LRMLSEHNHPEVSAIVAAHPDDEILWFSSILADAGKIILCFEDVPGNRHWSEGRRASTSQYPLPQLVNIALSEADIFHAIDWTKPVPSAEGLEIPGTASGGRVYADNFMRLVDRLGDELDGCSNVFTHAPWGEYGNAEHIQVFRAVMAAAESSSCRVWVPGYVSNATVALLTACEGELGRDVITLPTNQALARDIASLYKANNCWTWYKDYQWPAQESFRVVSTEPVDEGAIWPVNHISIRPPAPPRQSPGLTRRLARRFRRLVNRKETGHGR